MKKHLQFIVTQRNFCFYSLSILNIYENDGIKILKRTKNYNIYLKRFFLQQTIKYL